MLGFPDVGIVNGPSPESHLNVDRCLPRGGWQIGQAMSDPLAV
jgi:hypothetical protein